MKKAICAECEYCRIKKWQYDHCGPTHIDYTYLKTEEIEQDHITGEKIYRYKVCNNINKNGDCKLFEPKKDEWEELKKNLSTWWSKVKKYFENKE